MIKFSQENFDKCPILNTLTIIVGCCINIFTSNFTFETQDFNEVGIQSRVKFKNNFDFSLILI